jgi:hypothetical protein
MLRQSCKGVGHQRLSTPVAHSDARRSGCAAGPQSRFKQYQASYVGPSLLERGAKGLLLSDSVGYQEFCCCVDER